MSKLYGPAIRRPVKYRKCSEERSDFLEGRSLHATAMPVVPEHDGSGQPDWVVVPGKLFAGERTSQNFYTVWPEPLRIKPHGKAAGPGWRGHRLSTLIVGQHGVHQLVSALRLAASMHDQGLDMIGNRIVIGFARLSHDIAHVHARRLRVFDGLGNPRCEQIRND